MPRRTKSALRQDREVTSWAQILIGRTVPSRAIFAAHVSQDDFHPLADILARDLGHRSVADADLDVDGADLLAALTQR